MKNWCEGMTVRAAVEAVDSQTADLVSSGAAPPRDDQRAPLVEVGQLERGHECGEFVVGDELRHPDG
jgi:hypothetical protein